MEKNLISGNDHPSHIHYVLGYNHFGKLIVPQSIYHYLSVMSRLVATYNNRSQEMFTNFHPFILFYN